MTHVCLPKLLLALTDSLCDQLTLRSAMRARHRHDTDQLTLRSADLVRHGQGSDQLALRSARLVLGQVVTCRNV